MDYMFYKPGRNSLDSLTASTTRSSIAYPGEARVITTAEYKQAARALAEAFFQDKVARYFVDTPETTNWSENAKWDLHLKIMEYLTYAHILKGLVTTAGDDYGCVALWMPPGAHMDDTLTLLRSGLWRLHYQLPRESRIRFFTEFFPLLHQTKSSVLGPLRDHNSYYLVYIGTRPTARGKGLARRCIEFCTKMADEKGKACYLESSNEVNLGFYGRMGFETTKKIALERCKDVVYLDIMVREPVQAITASRPEKFEERPLNEKTEESKSPPPTEITTVPVTNTAPTLPEKSIEKAVKTTAALKDSTLVKTEQVIKPVALSEAP